MIQALTFSALGYCTSEKTTGSVPLHCGDLYFGKISRVCFVFFFELWMSCLRTSLVGLLGLVALVNGLGFRAPVTVEGFRVTWNLKNLPSSGLLILCVFSP